MYQLRVSCKPSFLLAHSTKLVVLLALLLTPVAANAAPSKTFPLVTGFSGGQRIFLIATDASDPAVATQSGATLVPRLTNLIAANATSDAYQVTNFDQAKVFTALPSPLGPNNTKADYSPFWRVKLVTWQTGSTPRTLRSESEILAAQAAGQVTIETTDIVINCPVVFTPSGGGLPGAKGIDPHVGGTITLPLIKGFASGDRVFAIITDASDQSEAETDGANFAPKLLNARGSGAEEDLYPFEGNANPAQDRVFEAHPTPVGPTNTEEDYTPAWNIIPVSFTDQARHKFPLIRDEEDIYDLVAEGENDGWPGRRNHRELSHCSSWQLRCRTWTRMSIGRSISDSPPRDFDMATSQPRLGLDGWSALSFRMRAVAVSLAAGTFCADTRSS